MVEGIVFQQKFAACLDKQIWSEPSFNLWRLITILMLFAGNIIIQIYRSTIYLFG